MYVYCYYIGIYIIEELFALDEILEWTEFSSNLTSH